MTLTDAFLKASHAVQNWVIVHECTHLRHHSVDNAYKWQTHYGNLRGSAAEENADTITEYLLGVVQLWQSNFRISW